MAQSARKATSTHRSSLRLRDTRNAPVLRSAASMATREMLLVVSADDAHLVPGCQPLQPTINQEGQK
jgi:hypothetical protein